MIEDFRRVPKGTSLETDLCIIGAGAAGISIAKEFANRNIDVCLVESGGLEFDAATQALYDFENVGLPIGQSLLNRLRFFGGTTNHWDGRCAPFDEIDFVEREWIPYSGWPITRQQLDPFYLQAQSVCGLGDFIYDNRVLERFDIPEPPVDPEVLSLRVWQLSPPTRFGSQYRSDLQRSTRVKTFLYANVTNIQSGTNGSRVEYVDVRSLEGNSVRIRAKIFVLCCGAIENARLLLSSNSVDKKGLGNRHDVVGRYYMEHLRWNGIASLLDDPYALQRFYNWYRTPEGEFQLGLGIQGATQRTQKMLNVAAVTYFVPDEPSSYSGAKALAQGVTNARVPDEVSENTLAVLRNLDEVISNFRRKVMYPHFYPLMRRGVTSVFCELEQAPNPDSRVTLSEQRDALGMNQARVDWRLTSLDQHSMRSAIQIFGAELARTAHARLRVQSWMDSDLTEWSRNFQGVAHHIGTTRMSDDPKKGVVDRNCKVHGLDNLYIAGSSVFPTGGQANPTLTLVALALRLSDHLQEKVSQN